MSAETTAWLTNLWIFNLQLPLKSTQKDETNPEDQNRDYYCWWAAAGAGVLSSLAIALSLSFPMATGIGAMRLFLFSRPSSSGTVCSSRFFWPGTAVSSRPDSLCSLARRPEGGAGIPLTELLALCVVPCPGAGVSGGVHIGADPEFAAARLGTEDMDGVGAFIVPGSPTPGANDDAVAMLDTELLLVGLPGLAGTKELGDAGKPDEGCRCIAGGFSMV